MHQEFVFINYVLKYFFPSNGQSRGHYFIQNIIKLLASVIPSTVQAPLHYHYHIYLCISSTSGKEGCFLKHQEVCPSL